MWPWRKRSRVGIPNTPTEQLDLPKKCFISHSYRDADARQRLLAQLPIDVEPFIFPPITVPPDRMVSNELIAAILGCDGLIYLEGGASASSFWVAFERDYALRAGKSIFVYDSESGSLRRDTGLPQRLPVFLSHSHRDGDRVSTIHAFMRDDRYFDTLFDTALVFPGPEFFTISIQGPLRHRLHEGGYMVLFWSQHTTEEESGEGVSPWVQADLEIVSHDFPDRILLALLDRTPVFPALAAQVAPPQWVQVFGDAERSEAQRLDDLIVRLYWLIYRNTRQNQLG